ncbi:MAG: ribbon-helix-helix protein, CopG family [Nitrospiraceae bacterium]
MTKRNTLGYGAEWAVWFWRSLDEHLLGEFDRLIERRNYTNCSEAIRDLIRNDLVEQQRGDNQPTVGY